MRRINRDDSWLLQCVIQALRGTCVRRRTACIITDIHGFQLSSGYNGKESGAVHCFDSPCHDFPPTPGLDLDTCQAIHAEANALVRLKEPMGAHTLYCTVSPCVSCVKLIMGTSIKRIVFIDEYPHNEISRAMWVAKGGREWIHRSDLKSISSQIAELIYGRFDLMSIPY